MIDESNRMVVDTEKKLEKATGDLKDLIVSSTLRYINCGSLF